MAESGENMCQLTALVEAICKDFRGHDEGEIRRLVEWQRVIKTHGANNHTSVGCPPPPLKKREPQGHPITHVNETTLRHPSYFRFKALLEALLCPRWLPKGNLGKRT